MPAFLKTKRLVWAAIFCLVTLVAALSYVSGTRYVAAMAAVEHTLALGAAVDDALSLLKDAETGQRGYLLSGEPHFLEPYVAAGRDLAPLLRELERTVEDDPEQARRMRQLRPAIGAKYAFIDEVIRLRREARTAEAVAAVSSGKGKVLMDSVRALCKEMLAHEQNVLSRRKAEAERAKRRAFYGVGIGSVLTVLLALFSLITVHRDVNEMKRLADAVAASEKHYRLIAEQSSDLVRLLDPSGATTYVSPSVERHLGYTIEEFLVLPPQSLLHPDDAGAIRDLLESVRRGAADEGSVTYRLCHRSGEYRWFEVRWAVRRTASGAVRDVHTAGRDVTDRRQAEARLLERAAELQNLSVRDELTGLYNRRGFMEVAGQALEQATRDQRPAALVFVDLNGMKRINDELGHEVGDLALVDAASVVSGALGASALSARLGGDEFVAFVLDFTPERLDEFRSRVRSLADARVAERGRPYRLSMSAGGAFKSATEHVTLEAMLERADADMYAQKNARRAAGGLSLVPGGQRLG